jgi:putative membrane protein
LRLAKKILNTSAAILFVAAVQSSSAHGGGLDSTRPANWPELVQAWEFDWGVIVPLLLSGWLYVGGVVRLWRATHVGCGIRAFEVSCFCASWLALVLALVSPLHPWGRVLFAAHMTQHEILMLVAAPLLVMSRPILAFLKALPGSWAGGLARAANTPWWRRVWRFLTNSFVAWLIHALALWLWHLPSLFDATIHNDFIHSLQHLSFFGSALLFWWAVIHGPHRAMSYGMAVLYMFTTALHNGLLGVLLSYATTLWYPAYADTSWSWGLTPVEDQQLGGLIMWVPAGLVYVFAALALFVGWLRESERRVLARQLQSAGAGL